MKYDVDMNAVKCKLSTNVVFKKIIIYALRRIVFKHAKILGFSRLIKIFQKIVFSFYQHWLEKILFQITHLLRYQSWYVGGVNQ